MTFEIGDKVIYPNHGLGIVERIETKTIMGTTCGFYQLRMANETTVFVPVDNVEGVGLRRAVTDQEVERLLDLLGNGKIGRATRIGRGASRTTPIGCAPARSTTSSRSSRAWRS